jgi:hypothetical protein
MTIYEVSFLENVEEVVSHLLFGEKLQCLKGVLLLIRFGDSDDSK